jgi:hypothetical protein
MLGELRRRLEERQGRMLLGARAGPLRLDRGRVVGVEASRNGVRFEVSADTVVIADGGFPANPELFRKYIGSRPDRLLMRHPGTAIGDGLRMAEAAGAALTRLDRFYGHLLSRDAMENTGLWPYPQIDAIATAAIVVGPDGQRLLDEGLGGISITNDLARLDDPLCATVICDAPIWETAGKAAQIPPNPQLLAGGGTLHQARTLEGLTELAGLPPEALAETVDAYNNAVRFNRLATLLPERSTRSGQPRRIDTPPFYAIPICAGITNTFGGIAIDGHGRVKRPDGSVITGLYAAGGATGGLEGGGALGYVGGLIKACVFGLRAGEHAAGFVHPSAETPRPSGDRPMKRAIVALALLLASGAAGYAQTIEDVDKREAAVLEAWSATPLTIRRAVFVAGAPEGFGQYVERANSTFKKGEKLVTYAEPVGFGWKDIGNGLYEFGFKADFLLKSPDGKVLGGQEDFADLSQKSHARNREFMVILTLNLTGAPPGDYLIEYKLRDVTGAKSATFSQPFKIAE